ncbi:hypothetical protein FL966_05770 [Caproiciproducens galactitolivorans]|uniref:Uncharacterized protein n=1 Tax=Caproiciproducens galactitolivorans TaxID=642589 RepID=A0A4Z0YLR2_9FIRM|nr:hypothetical protein [Caproiciproducens galactitolivorans]QEY34598.1 hypothetical protein FL966_05770 [Caproiciproducens galactitolivorans]TGJ77612.1 hypothetical protein CAGA_00030 [Caproiciproducens galactitolivorans]
MKTRLVSLLLCLIMCFSFVPNTGYAAKRATYHPKTTSSATVKKAIKKPVKTTKKASVKKVTKKSTGKKNATKTVKRPAVKNKTVAQKASAPAQSQTVYWVDHTNIYHSSKNCRTLRKSKAIHNGTIKQANRAGHSRLCKVCG